jgi:hypothetical protein
LVRNLVNKRNGDDMTENARAGDNTNGQLSRFSGIISKWFSKAKQRLIE